MPKDDRVRKAPPEDKYQAEERDRTKTVGAEGIPIYCHPTDGPGTQGDAQARTKSQVGEKTRKFPIFHKSR